MAILPLSEPVPLRTTAVWGAYKDVQAIPKVWGNCTLTPVQYDQRGVQWVINDGASVGVDEVKIDDAVNLNWTWQNTVDSTGATITLLELGQPLLEDAKLSVTVRGLYHHRLTALADNPADVLLSMFAWFGMDVTEPELDAFRAETAKLNITVGGVAANTAQTRRSLISTVCNSVGAIWTRRLPGIAKLYPVDVDPSPVYAEFDILTASNISAGSSLRDVYTEIELRYDYDWTENKYKRVIGFQADDETIRRYGNRRQVLEAPWLHSPSQAQQLGERQLRFRARPQWTASFQTGLDHIGLPPGAQVSMQHPLCPIAGKALVMDVEPNTDTGTVAITINAAYGDAPAVNVTALSTAFEPIIPDQIAVIYRDGVATFTILDEAGKPLAGAKATLDGDVTRITDAAGRVQFTTSRGTHLLLIEATGFVNQELQVEV